MDQQISKIKNILYIGSGYVGSLSALTMAVYNQEVQFTVFDINRKLIDSWNRGEMPFYEPELEEIYSKAKK